MFGFKRQKIREPSLEELQTIASNYLQINSFDIEYKDNYTMTELQVWSSMFWNPWATILGSRNHIITKVKLVILSI